MSPSHLALVGGWILNGAQRGPFGWAGARGYNRRGHSFTSGELRTNLTHARWCDRLRMACVFGRGHSSVRRARPGRFRLRGRQLLVGQLTDD